MEKFACIGIDIVVFMGCLDLFRAHSPPLRQPIPPRLVSRHRCSTGRLSLQSLVAISPNSPYPPPVVIWVFVATIRNELFPDNIHLSKQGSKLMAETVYNAIIDEV